MKRLLRNTSWILFSHIFQMVISFFVGIFTARYLGPTNYGSITYVASYISFFSAICLMGLDTVVVNRLVFQKEKEGEIIASALFLRMIVSFICMCALTVLITVVDYGNKELFWIAVLSSFELFFKAFGTIGFWYQYKLLSKKTAVADMIAFVLASLFRIWLLITQKNIYWFAAYNSVVFLLIAVLYVPLFLKDCDTPIRIRKDTCIDLLKRCIPYLLSGVMISLYTQVDRIMIKHLLKNTTDVGYYGTAIVICHLVAFVPDAIALSSRPVLMDMKRNHAVAYEKRVIQVLASIIWFSLLYALFVTVFAPWIINVLYGSEYAPTAPVLRILVWCAIVENLTKIRDIWLIGENQSKYVTVFSFLGTVINIVLNYILITRFAIKGAAMATVLTQFLVTLLVPALFRETRTYSKDVLSAMFLRNMNLKELYHEVINAFLHKENKTND